MRTKPRKFKLFVTPGTLRWNRYGSGGGGGGFVGPALDPFSLSGPPILATENWTSYIAGNWDTTAVAHWGGFSLTQGHALTDGTQFSCPANVQNGGTWNAATINPAKDFWLRLKMNSPIPATGVGYDNTCLFAFGPTITWGLLVENFNGGGGQQASIISPTAVGQAVTKFALAGGINAGDVFTLKVKASTLTASLYQNNTLLGTKTAPNNMAIGTYHPVLSVATNSAAEPAGNNFQVGTLKAYGFSS